MPRPIWKGHISFGLVQIPVALYSAVERDELSFTMLDGRTMARVGYERVNKDTGEPVPWEDVVKGYEVERGEYVVLGEEDFKAANVEATQSVDIVKFVEGASIDPMYYDRPYYLEPSKKGQKAYALLREVLRQSGRVGLARVVIRKRQHLAALLVRDDALVLELLRYPYELRDMNELELPARDPKKAGASKAELEMAKQLVSSMAGDFDPEEYADEYRADLLALIERKVERGEVNAITPAEAYEEEKPAARAADLMSLLKQSVQEQKPAARRKTAPDTRKRAARTARAPAKGTRKKKR